MNRYLVIKSLGMIFAAVLIVAATLSIAPIALALAAPLAQLLPAIGAAQSFSMTLSLHMPKGEVPDDGAPGLTMKVSVKRSSANAVDVAAEGGLPIPPPVAMSQDGRQNRVFVEAGGMGSGERMQARYAINASGLLDPGNAPHPFVGVYDNALIVGRAASAHRVGESWNTTIEMFGPGGPPPMAGGLKRAFVRARAETIPSGGEGPPRERMMMVVVPSPQPVALTLRIVSMQGAMIKVEGSGKKTIPIETSRGRSQTNVTMSVEETIVGGRLVEYRESTSSAMPGPNGTMDVGATTRLVAN